MSNHRTGNSCYLLSGTQGIVEPRVMQYRFKRILAELHLSDVSFHSLRHLFATNCIAIGVDVKSLSEILGHSNVQITLNRYVHSSMEQKVEYMKSVSDLFSVALRRSKRTGGEPVGLHVCGAGSRRKQDYRRPRRAYVFCRADGAFSSSVR